MKNTNLHEVRGRVRNQTLAQMRRIQARLDLSESKAVRDALEFYVRHAPEVYQRLLTEDEPASRR